MEIDLNKSTLPTIDLDEDYINEISNLNLKENDNDFTANKIEKRNGFKKRLIREIKPY